MWRAGGAWCNVLECLLLGAGLVSASRQFQQDPLRARTCAPHRPTVATAQAAVAADREEAARQQAEALAQRLAHLTSKLGEVEDERRAELAPDIKAARDEVGVLQAQLEAERAKAAGAQREAADIAAKLEAVSRCWGGLCWPVKRAACVPTIFLLLLLKHLLLLAVCLNLTSGRPVHQVSFVSQALARSPRLASS